jgi:hypothetical protein
MFIHQYIQNTVVDVVQDPVVADADAVVTDPLAAKLQTPRGLRLGRPGSDMIASTGGSFRHRVELLLERRHPLASPSNGPRPAA